MSLNLRLFTAVLALIVVPSNRAFAEDETDVTTADTEAAGRATETSASDLTTNCVHGYEQGQEQRKAGRLMEARQTLQMCARDECPAFIRSDCSVWHSEVQNEVPTVVFIASSDGQDVTDVRVSIGNRLLTERIDGQAFELNPGEYDLTFVAPGMRRVRQHLLIARGERNRLLRVELEPADAPSAAVPLESPLPPSAPRSLLVPGVLAGVGIVGVAGFGVLGAWGRASEAKLRDSCSPHCIKSEVSSVRTKYVLADVSLAVGAAGLAAAAYFFLTQEPEPAPAMARRLDVQMNADRLSATYGGAF